VLLSGLDRVAASDDVRRRVAHGLAVDVEALDSVQRKVTSGEALGQVGQGLTITDLGDGGANPGDKDADLVAVGHVFSFLFGFTVY